jgi:hypothetical protein
VVDLAKKKIETTRVILKKLEKFQGKLKKILDDEAKKILKNE